MIKIFLVVIVTLFALTSGLAIYNFKSMEISYITTCAMDKGGFCKIALTTLRGNQKDISDLEANGGLNFIFAGYDGATLLHPVNTKEYNKRLFQIADFYLSNGININHISPIDQLTPLHGAVLFNQIEVLKYLLDHDAKKNIIPPKIRKNPLELALQLQLENKGDYSAAIELLSSHKKN